MPPRRKTPMDEMPIVNPDAEQAQDRLKHLVKAAPSTGNHKVHRTRTHYNTLTTIYIMVEDIYQLMRREAFLAEEPLPQKQEIFDMLLLDALELPKWREKLRLAGHDLT